MNIGAFGENFPYSNFHDLNMDWIVKIAKDFLDQYTNIQNVIAEGLENLDSETTEGLEALANKATELEGLLQQWYNTHSEDIANQLASALEDLNSWYTTHEGYLNQYLTDSIAEFNRSAEAKAVETIASIPADYTTLSNTVTGLQTAITDYKFFSWVLGTIADATGADQESNSRIRSGYLMLPKGTVISVMGGCNIVVYGYNRDLTARRYLQNTWTANDVVTDIDGFYRIAVRNATNSTILEAEIPYVAENVFIKYVNYQSLVSEKDIVPFWNNGMGGIYIESNTIKMKENGFGLTIDGFRYYIASADHSTEYTFTKDNQSNYPYFLVLDTNNLGGVGVRTDPTDCLSVLDIYTFQSSYKPSMVIIAEMYLGYWEFISPFDYFSSTFNLPISKQLAENNLIRHMTNTASVFNSALASGFTIMECDLRYTSDGVGVLSHDATITSGGTTYTISTTAYATLKTAYQELLTIEEYLLMCKKKNITAEIDFAGITPTGTQQQNLVNIIVKTGMISRCFVTCVGSIARQMLSRNKNLIICVSGVANSDDLNACGDIIKTSRFCIISIIYPNMTGELIEAIHNKGALAKTWTVNDSSAVSTFFDEGCDLIITDTVTP